MTLIELVIAIAITALVGVIASQMLSGMITNNQQLETHTAELAKLQRALTIIQSDLDQIALSGRQISADITTAERTNIPGLILEFTRFRASPAAGVTADLLERVRYVIETDTLVRYSLPVAQPAQEDGWYRHQLLDTVNRVTPYFLAQRWSEQLTATDNIPLAALRLAFDTERWHTFEVVSMTGAQP